LDTTFHYAGSGSLDLVTQGLGSYATVLAASVQALPGAPPPTPADIQGVLERTHGDVNTPILVPTTYTLDVAGRSRRAQGSQRPATAWTRNAAGDVLSRTEAVGDPLERTTNYRYDAHGGLASITYPGAIPSSESFVYDDLYHQLIEHTDVMGHTSQ